MRLKEEGITFDMQNKPLLHMTRETSFACLQHEEEAESSYVEVSLPSALLEPLVQLRV